MYYLESLFIFSFNVFSTVALRVKHLLVCLSWIISNYIQWLLSFRCRKKILFPFYFPSFGRTEQLGYTGTDGCFCRPAEILNSGVARCLCGSRHVPWEVASVPALCACSHRLDGVCMVKGSWLVLNVLMVRLARGIRFWPTLLQRGLQICQIMNRGDMKILVFMRQSLYYLHRSQSRGVLGTMTDGACWAASGLQWWYGRDHCFQGWNILIGIVC